MHKISIKNFGPITEYEQVIHPANILIGPQASGKSTISKLVFFFRSIRDDLLKYILDEQGKREQSFEFNKQLRSKFVRYFGTTKHMSPFKITYHYNERKSIILTLKDGYVQISFSQLLKEEIYTIFSKAEKIHKEYRTFSLEATFWAVHDKKISDELKHNIDTAFEDFRTSIFIPAGRSLVAILADQLQNIHPHEMDQLMQDFLERIRIMRKVFTKSFEDIIQDRKKLSNEKIYFKNIELAISIINRILKGKYIFSTDGERIYFNENEYTKLMYSSSGQQEVIWIVLLLFVIIMENRDVFIVIEEPEAHLFPTAQRDMIELIALLITTSDSHVMITTHSPYILSAFNIYLYAGKLTKQLDNQNKLNIDKKLRITKPFTAYFVNSLTGKFQQEDIVDSELGLIKAETIDDISNEMNEMFDQFIELEAE